MKDYKIASTILLGIVLAIMTVILAVMMINARPPKLSEQKMQKNAEEAQKAEEKDAQNLESEDESEEKEHTKEFDDFDVAAVQSAEIGNKAHEIKRICCAS